jgi:DNA-binding response OmpR family regulator
VVAARGADVTTAGSIGWRPSVEIVVLGEDHATEPEDLVRPLCDAGFDVTVTTAALLEDSASAVVILDGRPAATRELAQVLRGGAVWRRPAILVTDPSQAGLRVYAVTAGIDDDAIAPVSPTELVARVKRALTRARGAPTTTSFGGVHLDRRTRTLRRGARSVRLTEREFAIFLTLAQHPSAVVTKEVILAEAWPESERPGTSNAVEVHVSALRRKLEELGPPILHTAHGEGYVLEEAPWLGTLQDLSESRARLAARRQQLQRRRRDS